MKCQRAHELIHGFLDGVISPPDRCALDEHLAGCSECRRELGSTRTVLGMLADTPRRRLSEGFDEALNARLAAIGPRRSPWPVWGRLWEMNAWRLRPALVPLAAVLAGLIAFQAVPERETQSPGLQSAVYVAECVREHEAGARWGGLPEAAAGFNLQVSSAATVAADLIQ